MSWATKYIEKLLNGETVKFRPKGNSMLPKIKSGQLCTVEPITNINQLNINDIVLCKVHGKQYLHLVKAIKDNQVQIGNNKGYINGWTSFKNVFGRLINIED